MNVIKVASLSILVFYLVTTQKVFVDLLVLLSVFFLNVTSILPLASLSLVSFIPPYIPVSFTQELGAALLVRELGFKLSTISLIIFTSLAFCLFNYEQAISISSPFLIFLVITKPIFVSIIVVIISAAISLNLTWFLLMLVIGRRVKKFRNLIFFFASCYCFIKAPQGGLLKELFETFYLLSPLLLFAISQNSLRLSFALASMTIADPLTALLLTFKRFPKGSSVKVLLMALVLVNLVVANSLPRALNGKEIIKVDCSKILEKKELWCSRYNSAWVFNQRICYNREPSVSSFDCKGRKEVLMKGIRT